MKVFISWSKEPSQQVALALKAWLRPVIQLLDPWVSASDIDAGKKWSREIEEQLEKTSVGILCITRQNLVQPWLMFEAGALAKAVASDTTRVIPYLFDVTPSDLTGPLASFQGIEADKNGTRKLVRSLNAALGPNARPDGELDEAFEVWWPKLAEKLDGIRSSAKVSGPVPPPRSEREILEEILATVRQIHRSGGPATRPSFVPAGIRILPRLVREGMLDPAVFERVLQQVFFVSSDVLSELRKLGYSDDEVRAAAIRRATTLTSPDGSTPPEPTVAELIAYLANLNEPPTKLGA